MMVFKKICHQVRAPEDQRLVLIDPPTATSAYQTFLHGHPGLKVAFTPNLISDREMQRVAKRLHHSRILVASGAPLISPPGQTLVRKSDTSSLNLIKK